MTFLKRSWISISRQPIKSIILACLVFILGTIVLGALAIEIAIVNTDTNLRRNMRPVVTLEIDRDVQEVIWGGEIPRADNLTSEMMSEIGELSYVSHFDYYFSSLVYSFDLETYQSEHFTGQTIEWGSGASAFMLKGTSEAQLWDVTEKVVEIVSGRTFTDLEIHDGAYVAVVSRGFAELNNLYVGSVFRVNSIIFDWSNEINLSEDNIIMQKEYEFKIIGLFEALPQEFPSYATDQQRHQDWSRVNLISSQIYVPNLIARNIENKRYRMIEENDLFDNFLIHGLPISEELNAMFTLYDPFDLDAFREAAEPILPDVWTMIDLTDTFSAISGAMITLGDIASLILWFAVIGALVILTLVILLFLRDRRYEIGVYLALGEKKSKIMAQIMLEVAIMSMISLTLAIFAGSIISQNLSQLMIRTELASAERNIPSAAMFFDPADLMWSWGGLGVREFSTEEMIEAFDVSLDLETTVIFYSVGLFVVLLSTFIAVIYVVRIDPKKVLIG